MTWTDDSAVRPLGDGRYAATLPDRWSSLQGAHGGLVAAIATRATDHALATQTEPGAPLRTLRAATFGYMRGNVIGDIELTVDVMRVGKGLATSHVTVNQDGRTTLVARLHHSQPVDGETFSDDVPPAPRHPAANRLDPSWPDGHLGRVETWLHPATQMLGSGSRAEWIGWNRPHAGDELDLPWLVMLGDYYPPAVFTRSSEPRRAVTIEYSVQLHTSTPPSLGADGLIAAHMHTFHAADGYAVEDGTLHAPDGALLMTIRQARLAG